MAISDELEFFWDEFHDFEPTVRLGGIYANKPGYHNTREANLDGDYSIYLPADRQGRSDLASAIDLTLPADKMRWYTSRLKAAALDPNDDRTSYIREFIGTLDGENVYCLIASGPGTAFVFDGGRDDSHLWHIHISFYRMYADWSEAMRAILSVLMNESYEEYLGGETMTPDQFLGLLKDPKVSAYLRALPLTYPVYPDRSLLHVILDIHKNLGGGDVTEEEITEAVKRALREGTG